MCVSSVTQSSLKPKCKTFKKKEKRMCASVHFCHAASIFIYWYQNRDNEFKYDARLTLYQCVVMYDTTPVTKIQCSVTFPFSHTLKPIIHDFNWAT